MRRSAVPVLVLLALALRLVWPHADPATRFSWSNGIYTDPPTMVLAARNAALFGQWILDYNRDLWVYPLMNVLTWLAYLPAGPGRLPTEVLSALFGAATVAALAWGLGRTAGRRAALIGAGLGAVNYWMVMFSRIPVAENLVTMLLALACVAAAGRSARAQLLAGALGVGATLFGKYHALGFLPGLVALPWLRERRFRATLPVLAGGTAVFLVWLAVIFLPHREDVIGHVIRQSVGLHGPPPFVGKSGADRLDAIREGLGEFYNTLRRSWMFYRMPVCGALGSLFALWTLGNGASRRQRVADGSAIYAFWFLGMWLYFSLLPYKAPRYYVLLSAPLVAGAAVVLSSLLREAAWRPRAPIRVDEHVPLAVWLYSFAFGGIDAVKHYASMLLEYLTIPPPRISDRTFEIAVSLFRHVDTFYQNLFWALGLSVVAYVVVIWSPELAGLLRMRTMPTRRLGRGLIAVSVVFALYQYGWWAAHRTTFLEDVKSSLPVMIGEDAVLLGPMAPLLTQDTRNRVHPYFGPPRERGLLETYGITHVVVCGQGDADMLEERFPGLLDETTVVQVWPVATLFSSTLEVRRVPPVVDGVRINDYEPTLWEKGAQAAIEQDWQGALAAFGEYRRAGGRQIPELLSLESVCWFKLGDYDRAEALLREAIRERPLDPLNYQNLAVLHLRRGERAEALEALMTAVRLDPSSADLKKMISELTR